MSNHSGGYILNELLHEINTLGLLTHISDESKEKLIMKLLKLCGGYDCNWGEIIDEELASLFSVCRYCRKTKPEIGKGGYCVTCRIEIGEEDEE